MNRFRNMLAIVTVFLSVGSALAQQAEPKQAGEKLPSLDDLLNLPQGEKPDKSKPAGDKPRTGVLDDVKINEDPREPFKLAVLEMTSVAKMLGEERDTGLPTQRAQERIIKRLDQMISDLKKQQQQGQGSGQGQQQKQDTGSAKNQQKQQGKGQGKPQPGGTSAAQDSSLTSGSKQTKPTDEPLAERLAEWGALPPRLRDQLLQGLGERYSGLYRRLTERYYKRLAEESQ